MNETDSPEQKQSKTRTRYGLKSLLLVVLFVAISLSAFQFGHQVGFKKGDRSGFAAGLSAKVYPVSYRAADLVHQPGRTDAFAQLSSLAGEITRNVQPTSWDSAGGPGTVAEYAHQLTLVVSQTERAHDEISTFLEAKRAERGPITITQTATTTKQP